VDGIKGYKRISDIPFGVDVVNLVTPSLISEAIVKECAEQSIKKFGFNQGPKAKRQ